MPPSTLDSAASPPGRGGGSSSGSSSFLGRFSRRPRTANSTVPTSPSTDSFTDTSQAGGTSSLGFPSIEPPEGSSSSPSRVRSTRPSNLRTHTSTSITEQPEGNPIGRIFRRYSQGAGKNNAAGQEAAALAVAARTSSRISTELSRGEPSGSSGAGGGGSSTVADSAPAPAPDTAPVEAPPTEQPPTTATAAVADTSATAPAPTSVHRIRLVPHLEASRSLHFEPVERDLTEGARAVKIGRFTDRAAPPPPATSAGAPTQQQGEADGSGAADGEAPAGPSSAAPSTPAPAPPIAGSSAGGGGGVESLRVAFKSKVVSRGHAEMWCEAGGKFFIRDTRSSSGTFLNHIRLSAPGLESRPFPLKDGDIIQLGVDYQGGTEEIYRCVKMRVELNRAWQRAANQFNVNAMRQLRALQSPAPATAAAAPSAVPTNRQSMSVTDCCICLFSVTVCQALFIAPCSHVFHYKCIRPLLAMHHPGFSCPLCRTFADLEADVEQDDVWQEALAKEEAQQAAAAAAAQASAEPAADVVMQDADATATAAPTAPPREDEEMQEPSAADGRAARVSASEATARGSVFPHAAQAPASPPRDVLDGFEPTEDAREAREVMDVDGAPDVDPSPSTPARPVPIARTPLRGDRSADLRLDGLPASARWSPHTSALFDDSEARTPQNMHFLATLAEAPPPPRSSLRGVGVVGGGTGGGGVFEEIADGHAAGAPRRERSLTPVEAGTVQAEQQQRRSSDASHALFNSALQSPDMSRENSRPGAGVAGEGADGAQAKGKGVAQDAAPREDAGPSTSPSRKRERALESSWDAVQEGRAAEGS